jgi:hypothetical protein
MRLQEMRDSQTRPHHCVIAPIEMEKRLVVEVRPPPENALLQTVTGPGSVEPLALQIKKSNFG